MSSGGSSICYSDSEVVVCDHRSYSTPSSAVSARIKSQHGHGHTRQDRLGRGQASSEVVQGEPATRKAEEADEGSPRVGPLPVLTSDVARGGPRLLEEAAAEDATRALDEPTVADNSRSAAVAEGTHTATQAGAGKGGRPQTEEDRTPNKMGGLAEEAEESGSDVSLGSRETPLDQSQASSESQTDNAEGETGIGETRSAERGKTPTRLSIPAVSPDADANLGVQALPNVSEDERSSSSRLTPKTTSTGTDKKVGEDPIEPSRQETGVVKKAQHPGASELARRHDQVPRRKPLHLEGDPALAEKGMAPTEEVMAPTEESAPTEERARAESSESFSLVDDGEEVRHTAQLVPSLSERRPSLRHLKNRLLDGDDFSSDGEEANEMSSSDDDHSEEFDSGGGVATLLRDLPVSSRTPVPHAREEHVVAKQAPEESNVLDSFDLPQEALRDKVIESYSCGLYSGGLPVHGRLYVTSNHALFSGWRDTKVVLRLSDVVSVEKASTLRIVSNALTFNKRDGESITLGSFLFRDDCYTLILRLVMVSSSISKLNGVSSVSPSGAPHSSSWGQDSVPDDEGPEQEASPEPSESAPEVSSPRDLTAADPPGDAKFEKMVDAELPCTTAQAFAWIWGRDTNFWADFLRAQGEMGLTATRWRDTEVQSEAGRGLRDLFHGETFDQQRELTFTHPRTGFVVGPKKVFTRQVQGYRVERRKRSPGARAFQGIPPMDRVVLCQMTRMGGGAPMADHFTILGRVVLARRPPSRDGEPRCRVCIGFDVAFHKSTMLRGAIRSGAQEETRNTWKSWFVTAERAVKCQRHMIGHTAANDGLAAKPPSEIFAIALNFTGEEEATKGGTEDVSRDSKGESAVEAFQQSTDWAEIASRVVRWLAEIGIAAVKSVGVSTFLTLLGLLLVVMQQRDVRRLAAQVDQLAEAFADSRNNRDK
ncbi:unnamed protein product [Scytosiphon promiscuus]